MPPPPAGAVSQLLLSPAELSYLHSSLCLTPPIRPDGRTPAQFRPLVAETEILPGANGSARICFADGTEAVVGVKAEVEKSAWRPGRDTHSHLGTGAANDDSVEDEGDSNGGREGEDAWVDLSIEIPGCRDDDALPVFLSAMLTEALLASGELKDRLWINHRFHWKLYTDILLLSPPLSYPLPLLSLTTHLALLSTRLPKLVSEQDEDPLFDDDWEASLHLYPRSAQGNTRLNRPPITLLVIVVGSNLIFDPSKEELAVAEAVLAMSVGEVSRASIETTPAKKRGLQLLSMRTIDPPSRLTPPGVPNSMNTATGGTASVSTQDSFALREAMGENGVWAPPRGGVKRGLIAKIIKMVMETDGVAEEVMDGLDAVET